VRTFLQLLRVGFWMLPLQRWLTVIGAGMLVAGQLFGLPFNVPGSTLPMTFFGATLMMVVPLLAGGVFLRMLSMSRALLLRPHARRRLLAGFVGILVLVTCTWMLCYWLAFLPAPPRYKPNAAAYLLMFAMTFGFGTQCAVGLFIASRSPLWTLLVLFAWQLPGLLLHLLGVEDAARLLGGPVSLATSVLVWMVFAAWYLRARHIHASSWGSKEQSTPNSTARSQVATAPVSREQAMLRWAMGGSTPLRIGLQCLLAAVVMLAIQWVFAHDSGEHSLHAMMFGTLSVVAWVSGAVSSTMAAHARSLWLQARRSRLQLHAWMEWQMAKVALVIFAAVLLVAAALWLTMPRPRLPPAYLFCALLAPGLGAAWLGLMQQHRRSLFDALAGLAVIAGWFYGLVQPLYTMSAIARWDILAAQLGLALLLREVAYVRWRSADWRRAQRA
jgi:hypothetical protein